MNSLVTIIIPCNNSLYGLKNTVESLSSQFKIQGTRVLILDIESNDGSHQYAAQAAFEHLKKLKIESIKINDKLNLYKFIDQLKTLYSIIITPGTIFENPDFIFNSANKLLANDCTYVYFKNYPIFKRILPFKNIRNKQLEINCIISQKNFLCEIQFENNAFLIHTSQIKRKKIFIGGKL